MSAEILRRAAALMRERAEKAHGDRWAYDLTYHANTFEVTADDGLLLAKGIPGAGTGRWTAEHIASWHPAVALAVADWLDREAAWEERGATLAGDRFQALAVARAYLGESA